MDNHAARLIDDNDISVLIENIKGDVLRTNGDLLRRGEIARDALSSAQLIVRLARRSIYSNPLLFDQPLCIAARQIGHLTHEENVQPFARAVRTEYPAHRGSSFFCTKNAQRTAAVPRTMAMSATLKTGQMRKSKKSTTCPVRTRSIILLTAPAARATAP